MEYTGTSISIIILVMLVIYLVWNNALNSLKIGFYEETLKLNKDLFNEEYWKKIEGMFTRKNLFKK